MTRGWLLLIGMLVTGCNKPVGTAYPWSLPPGVPQPNIPHSNPMTVEKVSLGRHLFYDSRLSGNGQQSCASCHEQRFAFAEPRSQAIGSTGQLHRRNSSALVNVAYNATLTWAHPELIELERQHLIPMFGSDPVELGLAGHESRLLEQLRGSANYQALFSAAFGGGEGAITMDNVVKALASFTRSLVSFQSPFDRYAYGGDDGALSEAAKRGMSLFFSEQLECHHCHGGFNFSQSSTHENTVILERPFHNTGLSQNEMDTGLSELTEDPGDRWKFRAPTLRNVARSAPYMHDGSLPTLEAVVDFYAAGGSARSPGDRPAGQSAFVSGFQLQPEQREDLIAFLNSLTDESFLNNAAQSDPFVTR